MSKRKIFIQIWFAKCQTKNRVKPHINIQCYVQYHSKVSYHLSPHFSWDASHFLWDASRFLRDVLVSHENHWTCNLEYTCNLYYSQEIKVALTDIILYAFYCTDWDAKPSQESSRNIIRCWVFTEVCVLYIKCNEVKQSCFNHRNCIFLYYIWLLLCMYIHHMTHCALCQYCQ